MRVADVFLSKNCPLCCLVGVSRRLLCLLAPPLLGCVAVCACVFLVHCVLEFLSPWNFMSPWGDGSGKSERTQTTPTERPGDHGGPTVPAWSPGRVRG